MRLLDEIAVGVIERSGWTPELVEDEDAARAAMERFPVSGRYPILLTPLDTSGEKPFEEFVARDEDEVDVGLTKLGAVRYGGVVTGELRQCLADIKDLTAGHRRATKAEVVEWIRRVAGNFDHVETGRNLDQRM